MAGHGEKFQGEKSSIYKQVIYYIPSRRKIKYLIVFSPTFLFLKWFLSKKLLNILFSIKMEIKIYNSLSTDIFVAPCVYKLIIYIYIFSYLEADFTKKFCLELYSNLHTASTPYTAVTVQATKYSSSVQYFLFIYEHIIIFNLTLN